MRKNYMVKEKEKKRRKMNETTISRDDKKGNFFVAQIKR